MQKYCVGHWVKVMKACNDVYGTCKHSLNKDVFLKKFDVIFN
jgi:hypothetical protein